MKEPDEKLAQRAKKLFDRTVDGLDASTLSRLNRGRQAALAESQRGHRLWLGWVPVTGIAAAALVAVVVMRGPLDVDGIDAFVAASDMEILLGEESIDMLEDLEFYSLLDMVEQEENGDVS